eukprot:scaffold116580_cov21-Phaeocystis_antarctica.AAC.1
MRGGDKTADNTLNTDALLLHLVGVERGSQAGLLRARTPTPSQPGVRAERRIGVARVPSRAWLLGEGEGPCPHLFVYFLLD